MSDVGGVKDTSEVFVLKSGEALVAGVIGVPVVFTDVDGDGERQCLMLLVCLAILVFFVRMRRK